MNSIEVKNLTKRFGNVTAVDSISFEVKKGEFFGFLGPNGAGKTTTIRMLTGIIGKDDGSINIMGFEMGRQTLAAKGLMGIIPEVSNAYNDLTGWNNMMFQGELYGLDRKKRHALSEGLLKDFELYGRKDQLVKFYSKGMKQRLIICMALLNQPEIMFLDEPTSGLDVQSTFLIREKITSINAAGTTIFLTTHNMEEANQLCERIAIINRGKIAAIDTPENLKLTIRELQSVLVAFDMNIEKDYLSVLPGVSSVRKAGDKFQLYTKDPGGLVFYLIDFAREKKLKILTIRTETPTLEDVFLSLIGEKED
ncbi:MAG: ATP-binding cassette domain-containing protein [Actinobacteria bacterium]|nr:ATP-binding cassette domain-containing protein [Actinomycetota bacterium]